MYHIGLGFDGIDGELHGRQTTARGLHGVLYRVLREVDARGATWLHGHESPKPYTLVPYYHDSGILAGVRLSVLNERSVWLLKQAWETVSEKGMELKLGSQPFVVRDVACINGTTFESLSNKPTQNHVTIDFLSPTAFKKGRGHLPLPVPDNVFRQPYRVWNAFAPPSLQIPTDWLEWCFECVYIEKCQIETAQVVISHKDAPFTGFVGRVTFRAKSDSLLYLSLWQSIAHLIPYSGVGHKTTMGMGACEIVGEVE